MSLTVSVGAVIASLLVTVCGWIALLLVFEELGSLPVILGGTRSLPGFSGGSGSLPVFAD